MSKDDKLISQPHPSDLMDGSETQEHFRSVIRDIDLDNLQKHVNKAKNPDRSKSGLILQDLVNEIGRRLGFSVEFGVYRSQKDTIAFDGLWEWPTTTEGEDTFLGGIEKTLVVEVKKSAGYSIDPTDQPGKYMNELIQQGYDRDSVFGLIVVGDSETKTVIQSVKGSKYQDKIRVISVDDLLRLIRWSTSYNVPQTQVMQLLYPIESVDVGGIINTIQKITNAASIQTPDATNAPKQIIKISRSELSGSYNTLMCSHPSTGDSLEEIVKRYYAWGSVDGIPEQKQADLKYVCLYSKKESKIKYVGSIEDIVSVPQFQDEFSVDYTDEEWYDEEKIFFKFDTVYELEDPIHLENGSNPTLTGGYLPGRRYFTLGEFKNSSNLAELFGVDI